VTKVAYFNWFGAKDPKDENDFFATIATDPHDLFECTTSSRCQPSEAKLFENRRGAVVGDSLAKKKGWKVGGGQGHAQGTIFPGDWEFYVRGSNTATRSW